ncbi:DEAD/DEAH box helicase family protein [Dysgonomonas capnocytophagoides]|nr:DEAD/DEAH box helicase family protein [Dysgonomonas capnocytophagoides]
MAKNMTLKFESHLEYQDDAVNSICDIFEGEEIFQSNFSITPIKGEESLLFQRATIGIGNSIKMIEEDMLANMQRIQLRNGVPQSTTESFKKEGMNFSVEMETGTGKTYVYLKTIFELNKRYGFTKFIIVVPSIAIKEGTYKSLQITKEHFKGEYENVVYDYFVYDATKLEQVRSFATGDSIQIMVINIDAFRKSFESEDENSKSNIIHRYNDKLGYKPIDLIKETNPIVIIDEPQSVDNTDKAKEAIAALNPLCCLRYSATHRTPYNMMYKLDSVDAYELKLVKQIEVATASVEGFQNDAYIDLIKVDNKAGIRAQVELDFQNKGKVDRKKAWVKQGQDLFDITKRDQYEGYIVEDIWYDNERWNMSFTSNDKIIEQGVVAGSLSNDLLKREQIRMTIEAHLDKEIVLNPQGIKVLSLFFIDKVANYREYDSEGNRQNGKYARIFEEEYNNLIQKPKYRSLFNEMKDKDVDVSQIHDGYFSVDKQSKASNKKDKFERFVDTSGKTAKDDEAFNLIMRDKERLLSFDTPLRFIFSHSALREGWDNPNVFQICTLNETTKEIKKRQEIGRGLRLCVNQEGERVKGFEVNTLTVMANESYEEFAKALQNEIEEDTGIKFGYLHKHSFARIEVGAENDKAIYLNEEKSVRLYDYFVEKGYVKEEVINRKSKEFAAKVQEKLKIDLRDNRVVIPEEFDYIKMPILKILKRISGNFMNIKNRDDARRVTFRKEFFINNEDFKNLWDRIKYKTTYSVKIDSDKLITQCAQRIFEEVVVGRGRFVTRKVKLAITEGGVHEGEDTPRESTRIMDDTVSVLPDIVTYLQNETGLTRQSIVSILTGSKRLEAFKKNPQAFIESVIDIIRNEMRLLLVDGIKYKRIDNDMWCQELFENKELQGYISSNLLESNKSPYDYVIYDSETERSMAQRLESSDNVKVFTKLPVWFKIDTPLGAYNPDWALVWDDGNEQKLYFVVETKGGLFEDAIKPTERAKITCGKKHFAALETGIKLELADTFDTLQGKITS